MLPTLPVSDVLPSLVASLAVRPNAVLVAPPGAGKTTLVPLALLAAPWLGAGQIVMLEPRRLAARAAATRMAVLLGEAVGQTVGYRTRIDAAVSGATRIEVVTEGLLVRRLQGDPGLDGVAVVILDEVHERGLDADLALALCRDLQLGLRPELRLVAMSATAEAERLAGLLDAAVIESPGRAHPVTIRHAARDLTSPRDLPDAVARAVRTALAEHPGDVLAFLPGMAEIRRAATALVGCGALVLPLHGDLSPVEQDRALRPAGERRVVLATSIAETSLTVPGVRIVVDGGWRRAPRLDPATGLTRLATLRISRAAAEQRAGRAGREAAGVAVRLWTAALHRGLPAFDRPEILEAELSGLLLDCTAWGTAVADLPFPDPPPAGPLVSARALLSDLGALDADGLISALGRRMVQLGAHPRLAAMMLAATTPGEAALAADLVAALEERDPLPGPNAPADITLRLGNHALRQAATRHRRRLRVGDTVAEGEAGPLIAAGFPDRIAQRRGEIGSFRLSGGGGAKLPAADPLARASLLVVANLDGTGRIRLAASLDPERLPAALASRVTETVETTLDPVSGAVLARRRRRLGALVLADRTGPADPAEAADRLAQAATLPWTAPARQLQARVALMRGLEPDAGWPDVSDSRLDPDRSWLTPYLHGMTRLSEVARLDLVDVLRGQLSYDQVRALDRALPTHFVLPGGRAMVDYSAPVPVAAARAQAFYGLDETPRLADGRIRLRLALLSPAGRPVAITGDLAAFWRGAWADARKDMRGRYPKHDWPEHPARSPGRQP